jgi:hypothetical protein
MRAGMQWASPAVLIAALVCLQMYGKSDAAGRLRGHTWAAAVFRRYMTRESKASADCGTTQC